MSPDGRLTSSCSTDFPTQEMSWVTNTKPRRRSGNVIMLVIACIWIIHGRRRWSSRVREMTCYLLTVRIQTTTRHAPVLPHSSSSHLISSIDSFISLHPPSIAFIQPERNLPASERAKRRTAKGYIPGDQPCQVVRPAPTPVC